MAEVKLVIKADTTDAVKGVKELGKETQKLNDTANNGFEQRSVKIKKEIQMQEQLAQRISKTKNTCNLETYNKLLEGS